MIRYYLKNKAGKTYMFLSPGPITEVGAEIFTSLGTPLSTFYNGQYRLSSTDEVLTIHNSEVIKVAEDFDINYNSLDWPNLQKVLVTSDTDRILFIRPGTSILSEGSEVWFNASGTLVAHGEFMHGKYLIKINSGKVTEAYIPEVAAPELNAYQVIADNGNGPFKALVFTKTSEHLITTGVTIYADQLGTTATQIHSYVLKSTYKVELVNGVIVNVSKIQS